MGVAGGAEGTNSHQGEAMEGLAGRVVEQVLKDPCPGSDELIRWTQRREGLCLGRQEGAKPEADLNPGGREVASRVSCLEGSRKGRVRREAASRLV